MRITLLSMKILSIRVTLSWKYWGPSEAQGWVAGALKPVDLCSIWNKATLQGRAVYWFLSAFSAFC